MKKFVCRILCIICLMFSITICTFTAYALDASQDPSPNDIIVTNNVGQKDTIYVSGLNPNDIVRVYNASSRGRILASKKVPSTKTDVTLSVAELGSDAGSVYVSVTSTGMGESNRVRVNYDAEPVSEAPDASYITVINNAKMSDVIYINKVNPNTRIKVYNSAAKGRLIGSTTVGGSSFDGKISITQLGSSAGSVYISFTCKGELESNRTRVDYDAEGQSDRPYSGNISVSNNVGTANTVYISSVSSGDVVKAYSDSTGGVLLGYGTVSNYNVDLTFKVSDLDNGGGYIYISVTNKGKLESERTRVSYPAKAQSATLSDSSITVTNNVGKADTVYVSGLDPYDTVTVYNSSFGGKVLGSGTVGSNNTDITISIPQLGTSSGTVYVSVTGKNKIQSSTRAVYYAAENKTDEISSSDVVVTNNAGASDTVYVSGVLSGDLIKVYDSAVGGKVLGSAVVASSKMDATITIPQLGTSAGYVYVSVTSNNKKESDRLQVAYSAEDRSDQINASNIVVTNNAGAPDTVQVAGLSENDVVNVYDSAVGGKLLGTATVPAYGTSATISVAQLGTSSGSVYVTVTSSGKQESSRVKADYSAEGQSSDINPDNVVVTNNAGASDTVQVDGLSEKDVVNVYDAAIGGKLLGTATVAAYETSATVTVAQLGTTAGNVYITVTSVNKKESSRVKVGYTAEDESAAISSNNVIVTNNPGTNDDIVQVTGLSLNDVVNIYDAALGGNLLATATVTSSTPAAISVTKLKSSGGSIYVTVTSTNKHESTRTKIDYLAEKQSTVVNPDNVVVTNNAGTDDTVQVAGLSANDVVNIYNAAAGGKLLGTATAGMYDTSVTISIPQLGTGAGDIYVTVTSTDKLESARTKVSYLAEGQSTAANVNSILVTNNAGTDDTVQVSGLQPDDIVNVYSQEAGGKLLGTGTVSSYDSSVSIKIAQLGSSAGSVYISVTNKGKQPSARVKADYTAESGSSVNAANISIMNNVGKDDTVTVTGLEGGDVVKVYDAALNGNLLGSGTVTASGNSVTVSVSQLGSSAGSVYVSITSANKQESARTKANYDAEAKSTAPLVGNITIVNNAGIASSVTVSGLQQDDVVNVYDALSGGTLLGTGTVASYQTSVTVAVKQFTASAGNVYVSVTSSNKLTSDRTQAAYSAQTKSAAPKDENITIQNNAGIASTVKVSGLLGNDVVNVYDALSGGTLLGTGTVETYNTDVTISVSQLQASGGSVYVTVTSTGKIESDRTQAEYLSKLQSTAPLASDVTIYNNAGIADTVHVTGLNAGDEISVYSSDSSTTALATATVPSGSMQATATITQLGSGAGDVYVTVTTSGKTESARTKVSYIAESQSDAPSQGDITIENNSGSSDTITVTGLREDDVVKVYDAEAGGSQICSPVTVASGDTEAVISIKQLGKSAGSVYVTVTTSGKTESSRTKADYLAESEAPVIGNITVVNNAVIADTVTVTGLSSNDVVRIYDAASGGNLLGSAAVTSNSGQAEVSISQLSSGAGSIYVTVTSYGKSESSRTKVDYIAEQSSNPIYSGYVSIVNNPSGTYDTITVTNASPSDLIKVYDSASGGNLLGYATVSTGSNGVTISISQLSQTAGSVYLSVTNYGKTESTRTKVDYLAEP